MFMKNFGFCAISAVLMTVIFVSGLSILRSGEGAALMTSAKAAASRNSKRIADSTLEKYNKETITLPTEPRELTADMVDSVVIDGREYAFPIRMGDLSEEFSYSVMDCAADEVTGEVYVGILTLNYNGVSVSSACFESDTPDIDDDTVINKLIFTNDTNDYMPQITVGGIDVHNADVREVNRVYGYDSEEYGYLSFPAENDKGVYKIKLNKSGRITWLSFTDKDSLIYEKEFDRDIINYTDTIILPENYSFEEDAANRAMEYVPLSQKNEEFTEIMNRTFDGEPMQLPCTLNALISKCGDDAYFDYLNDSFSYIKEYGVYRTSGYIKFGENKKVETVILITPNKPIGEAQVIEVAFHASSDFIESFDIEGENPYGFCLDEDHEGTYYLTDSKYNNIKIEYYYFTLSYWVENTEKR